MWSSELRRHRERLASSSRPRWPPNFLFPSFFCVSSAPSRKPWRRGRGNGPRPCPRSRLLLFYRTQQEPEEALRAAHQVLLPGRGSERPPLSPVPRRRGEHQRAVVGPARHPSLRPSGTAPAVRFPSSFASSGPRLDR